MGCAGAGDKRYLPMFPHIILHNPVLKPFVSVGIYRRAVYINMPPVSEGEILHNIASGEGHIRTGRLCIIPTRHTGVLLDL